MYTQYTSIVKISDDFQMSDINEQENIKDRNISSQFAVYLIVLNNINHRIDFISQGTITPTIKG